MTTAHDVHRAMEENLFNTFQRHASIHSPATASLASFRSMTATDLIGLLPGSTHQQRTRMTRDRPTSDILQSQLFNNTPNSTSTHITESEAIDQWFENIQKYEQMLEEVAAASLDETFKDELQHVNQWFRCRSDAERTAALYSVVQNASQIQIRFLIMVLQQLANQEPFGNSLASAGQDKDSVIAPVAGSVVSTESEYERRKRQMYPPNRRGTNNINNTRSPIRITSASSEPDDLRRHSRDLFGPTRLTDPPSISSLGRQGLLHEKALAARAQIQAAHNGHAAALASVKSNSLGGRLQPLLSTTSSTPTNTTSSEPSPSIDTLQHHPSLFGTDWPFPLTRHTTERSNLVGRIGDHRSTSSKSSIDDAWSFGSLSKRKKDLMDLPSWTGRKSGPIREEQESLNDLPTRQNHITSSKPSPPTTNGMLNSTLHNSLNTLEQAQARLRGETIRPRQWSRSTLQSSSDNKRTMNLGMNNTTSSSTSSSPTPTSITSAVGSSSSSSSSSNSNSSNHSSHTSNTSISLTPPPIMHVTNMNAVLSTSPSSTVLPISSIPPSSPSLLPAKKSTIATEIPTTATTTTATKMTVPSTGIGHFLTPPTVYENEVLQTSVSSTTVTGYQSDHSDVSTGSTKEQVLTGTARRRKRSSAARALKDKIAAETVDLELMKDVQSWLRSLRLHKYGHAFIGLQWQQVVRMSDQDMIDAGVNTIGARRKLLKVFENVQRHCKENGIEY
ncbi:uncharacterized protein BX664DRAFT_333831 [Halteromyces radiatus]|uniref:uncharacterized protein n=1 Tax=Halteromyces radiatus TaxID=101107 RepID=UPI00221F6158|nr:uncharacterized protein BX664DRAFT_333831 [Halteromyces radiatus]KAI8089763.1 hypothetical protein BX664DRAFT_333831 [Halteromyces radiatus]